MKLRLKTLDGQRFEAIVDSDACSVIALKQQIQADRDISTAHQTIIYRGKILEDQASLGSYSISDNAFLVCLVRRPEGIDTTSTAYYLASHPNILRLRHEYQSTGNTGHILDAYEAWDSSSLNVIRDNQHEFLDILNLPLTEEEIGQVTTGLSNQQARLEEYVATANPDEIAEMTGISSSDVEENLPEVVNILRSLPDSSVEQLLGEEDAEMSEQSAPSGDPSIVRLAELGFPYEACLQAYQACDENEQLAANLLLSGTFQ